MQNQYIRQLLNNYVINSKLDFVNAIKEICQKIILVRLAKTNFFDYAVFYGGTSLRILRGLDRFSEDLDFTLTKVGDSFDFNKCMGESVKDLESYGIKASYAQKEKAITSSVISGYFKFNLKDSIELFYPELNISVDSKEVVSIKVELEESIIENGEAEFKLITSPSFAKIRTFNVETMFASKLLAIIGRNWKTRVKGRDYYDYLFYISLGCSANIRFIQNGMIKFGISDIPLQENEIKKMLLERFNEIDFDLAFRDVAPFVNNGRFSDNFDKSIFISTLDQLSFE